MKKNRTMRIAALLLALTLMTSCFVGGTFAKYTTSGTGSDNARVAHWGVKVTANGAMFEKLYAEDDTTYTLQDNAVISSDEWKVVAPGTEHGMTEVVLEGSPEVATRVTYEATVTLAGWTLSGGTEYCPVVFNVEGKTYGMEGTNATNKYATIDLLEKALVSAIAACKNDYVANTDLSTVRYDYPTVSWEWPFSTSDENDVKDTDLGNKAAEDQHAVIQIEIKTTITQID